MRCYTVRSMNLRQRNGAQIRHESTLWNGPTVLNPAVIAAEIGRTDDCDGCQRESSMGRGSRQEAAGGVCGPEGSRELFANITPCTVKYLITAEARATAR